MSAATVVAIHPQARRSLRPERPSHRLAYGFPRVPPHSERGRFYRSEYAWQEDQCSERLHSFVGCACSDYHRLSERAGKRDVIEASGLTTDRQVSPREALALIRPYLPNIRTTDDLFLAAAWQPFKVIFKPTVLYTDAQLIVWAKCRAAGQPAPWERDLAEFEQRRRA